VNPRRRRFRSGACAGGSVPVRLEKVNARCFSALLPREPVWPS
jgi:hypothetical protein